MNFQKSKLFIVISKKAQISFGGSNEGLSYLVCIYRTCLGVYRDNLTPKIVK